MDWQIFQNENINVCFFIYLFQHVRLLHNSVTSFLRHEKNQLCMIWFEQFFFVLSVLSRSRPFSRCLDLLLYAVRDIRLALATASHRFDAVLCSIIERMRCFCMYYRFNFIENLRAKEHTFSATLMIRWFIRRLFFSCCVIQKMSKHNFSRKKWQRGKMKNTELRAHRSKGTDNVTGSTRQAKGNGRQIKLCRAFVDIISSHYLEFSFNFFFFFLLLVILLASEVIFFFHFMRTKKKK